MIKNLFKKLSILKRKFVSEKKSYSFGGVDLLVLYLFKNMERGFYVDVGAQHPIANNNTYLLNQKKKMEWNGMNIDLDKKNIELFQIWRKKDINIQAAISSQFTEKDLYFYHDKSAINTIEVNAAKYQNAKVTEVKRIKTVTLNSILEEKLIAKINYLNIDVEGHEISVLEGLDLKKYSPDVVSIEFLDLSMKKLEFKNNKIENIIDSDLYKHMIRNNYSFINWNHADLIFVSNNYKDN